MKTLYDVAYRLHRTVDELGSMTFDEYHHWIAYFHLTESEPS